MTSGLLTVGKDDFREDWRCESAAVVHSFPRALVTKTGTHRLYTVENESVHASITNHTYIYTGTHAEIY